MSSLGYSLLLFDERQQFLAADPRAREILSLPLDPSDQSAVASRLSALGLLPVNQGERTLAIGGRAVGATTIRLDGYFLVFLSGENGEFNTLLVHELRAPLTVICGTADMFLENPQLALEESGKQLLETMRQSARGMLDMVTDLLDIAKIREGKFQVVKTAGNLTEVITERIFFFRLLAETKKISLAQNCPSELPLAFDRERITQVFNNLLSNAVKFTPVGGVVTVSAQKLTAPEELAWLCSGREAVLMTSGAPIFPCVAVAMTNSGSVIPAEQIPKLFSKFGQLLTTSADGPGGTGLGLVVVRGIVESHGGSIWVKSDRETGTTFCFSLPA